MIGGFETGLRAKYVEHPEWPVVRQGLRELVASGRVDYTSAIGQPFHGVWQDESYAAFGCVVSMVEEGEVVAFRLPLGVEPGPDADREGNAAGLAALPPAFGGEVFERQRNSPAGDGDLWWSEPITLTDVNGKSVTVARHGKAIPLEIGHTDAGTTYQHILHWGGVARWAYQSTDLVVFVNLRHFEETDL